MPTDQSLFRYRVAVIRRGQDGQVADPALREHITVHAPNGIAAQLLARAVTGAVIALEPERLGEVDVPQVAQSECGAFVVFA